MRALLSAFVIGAAALTGTTALAASDAEKAGKRVYMTKTCLACHGRNGAKAIMSYPNLAGQNEKYLVQQLKLIKSGERVGSVDPETGHPYVKGMADVMHILTEDDIKNVSKYLAKLTPAEPEVLEPAPSEEMLKAGEKAYKKLGCRSCHGKDATKSSNKLYPIIAGLDRDYLARQMTDMRDKVRTGGKVKLMYGVIKRAKDEDIEAMATWLSQIDRTPE
ncbi:c-type cytochrome [Alisedimentitalea sp. MJ-SS2]|uniref:c-type cytochrome n=1 Tax=Aliisedimentitalea sp. MJ-SS2 TaxID=3049795 RepID=UPI00290AE9EB|nr:c-type cytochrome [Alisedimentitalea sp. MJ-SS2]MDU8928523.1 c-type cytochrome [Alisedimentitalea sp. MJ-SS2]